MQLIYLATVFFVSFSVFATQVQYRVNAKVRRGNQIQMITEFVNVDLNQTDHKIAFKKLQGVELNLSAKKIMKYKKDSDEQFATGEIGLRGSITETNGPRLNVVNFPERKTVLGKSATLSVTDQKGQQLEFKLTPVRYIQ